MRALDYFKASTFVAIDFETADRGSDSACAIGLVRVENGRITDQRYDLIRPPRSTFEFTWCHGIRWKDVFNKPTFSELWPRWISLFEGSEFFIAHNASFDKRVLQACCKIANVLPPSLEFICSMKLARQLWKVRPTRLPDVCSFLGFTVQHHHALADAEACARIMIAAQKHCASVNPPI